MQFNIDITPRQHHASYCGFEIGKNAHEGARYLRDHFDAQGTDIMVTHGGGLPCLRAPISWWADHDTVEEDLRGLRTVKHRDR